MEAGNLWLPLLSIWSRYHKGQSKGQIDLKWSLQSRLGIVLYLPFGICFYTVFRILIPNCSSLLDPYAGLLLFVWMDPDPALVATKHHAIFKDWCKCTHSAVSNKQKSKNFFFGSTKEKRRIRDQWYGLPDPDPYQKTLRIRNIASM